MAVITVINPVNFLGKKSYVVEADIMPLPDGSGIVFRDGGLLTQDGLIPVTMVPWLNVASLTTLVPPSFFEAPTETATGPDEDGLLPDTALGPDSGNPDQSL